MTKEKTKIFHCPHETCYNHDRNLCSKIMQTYIHLCKLKPITKYFYVYCLTTSSYYKRCFVTYLTYEILHRYHVIHLIKCLSSHVHMVVVNNSYIIFLFVVNNGYQD